MSTFDRHKNAYSNATLARTSGGGLNPPTR
ncbi:hypothetical protein LMG27177_02060 [Paraburkholderia fynbosensis]|uniref:Uncharacterized protein n=1 Tax=Paraburkholderia fynbosensis TaxID=1200993 RepID=A0A6J5FYR2_9BURK|nr:hypothetical protein LMG27177_02060 [Paraburkholderia fynbosensis]